MEAPEGMEMHNRSKHAASETRDADYGNEDKTPSNGEYGSKQKLDVSRPPRTKLQCSDPISTEVYQLPTYHRLRCQPSSYMGVCRCLLPGWPAQWWTDVVDLWYHYCMDRINGPSSVDG
jgi:hypothetical protein